MKTIPEKSAEYFLLYNVLKGVPTGEIISYAFLSSTCGRNVQTSAYGILRNVRRGLEKEGTLFEPVRGEGLKRLGVGEVADAAPAFTQRLYRSAGREILKLSTVLGEHYHELTPEQKVRHSTHLTLASTVYRVTSAGAVKAVAGAVAVAAQQSPLPFTQTLEFFRAQG